MNELADVADVLGRDVRQNPVAQVEDVTGLLARIVQHVLHAARELHLLAASYVQFILNSSVFWYGGLLYYRHK